MLVESTTPILNVSDIHQSFEWFLTLGWEKAWEWGDPTGFGCVRSGNCDVFLCHNGQGGRGKSDAKKTFGPESSEQSDQGVWMSVWVEDVDQVYAHCQAQNIEITWEPTDMPWGIREMHIRHPDGHVFRISCPVRPQRSEEPCEFQIRKETAEDVDPITQVTDAAFNGKGSADSTEASIVTSLRQSQNLTLSLVAESEGLVIGHIAVSPVSLADGTCGIFGIGPLSVVPDKQAQGVGSALVNAALQHLRQAGAKACVLAGDPVFYRRFGFKPAAPLQLQGTPPKYFQSLFFDDRTDSVTVSFHESFDQL